MPSLTMLLIVSAQLTQTGVQILVSIGKYLNTHLKFSRRVSIPVAKTQLAGCLKVWVDVTQASNDNVQTVIQDTVYQANVVQTRPAGSIQLSIGQ